MADPKKAQDVFNDTNFVFSKKGTFAEAFPEIESIRVEVDESGKTRYGGVSVYVASMIGEYINCGNSSCYNGGFNIGGIIREMVLKKQETLKGSTSCQGYEGSPKGKRRHGTCYNEFEYTIEIKYKP